MACCLIGLACHFRQETIERGAARNGKPRTKPAKF